MNPLWIILGLGAALFGALCWDAHHSPAAGADAPPAPPPPDEAPRPARWRALEWVVAFVLPAEMAMSLPWTGGDGRPDPPLFTSRVARTAAGLVAAGALGLMATMGLVYEFDAPAPPSPESICAPDAHPGPSATIREALGPQLLEHFCPRDP